MALQLLATGRKEVPTTWDWITEHARQDQNASVRQAALALLATRYELDHYSRIILSSTVSPRRSKLSFM